MGIKNDLQKKNNLCEKKHLENFNTYKKYIGKIVDIF